MKYTTRIVISNSYTNITLRIATITPAIARRQWQQYWVRQRRSYYNSAGLFDQHIRRCDNLISFSDTMIFQTKLVTPYRRMSKRNQARKRAWRKVYRNI